MIPPVIVVFPNGGQSGYRGTVDKMIVEELIPLIEAVRMASLTPARVIHTDLSKGSLEAGKDADLVIYEPDFQAWRVMVGGEWVAIDA